MVTWFKYITIFKYVSIYISNQNTALLKATSNACKLIWLISCNNAIPEFLVFFYFSSFFNSCQTSLYFEKKYILSKQNIHVFLYTWLQSINGFNVSHKRTVQNPTCSYWYEVVSRAKIIDSQVKCLCKITFCQHLGFFDTRLCFYKRYLCLLYNDANIEWLHKPNLTSWLQPK